MNGTHHPLADRLRQLARGGPIVVAHRGDGRNHPENTLPAFAAAVQLGAPVQEFDVQASQDGVLVCIHDESLDRTTDAATALGPGALVAQLDARRLQQLDAGSWKGRAHAGARIPTLAEALAAMLPHSVPMIEHKAGAAELYAALLQQLQAQDQVLLQSFDWQFLRHARRLLPTVPVGLLGPGTGADRIDARVLDAARELGACFVHWHAPEVTAEAVVAVHAAGLLLVTYTSDTELAWCGGARLGIDAMCTNDPSLMLAAQRRGLLHRA
jgi:glycerophosphoryl diester phosphodiesterase